MSGRSQLSLLLVPATLLVSSIAKAPDFPTCQQRCVTKLDFNPDPGGAILSAAIDGDTAVVSESYADGVNVWVRSASGDWGVQAFLPSPEPPSAGPHFGVSLAIDGDTVIVGDDYHDNAKGAAYVFVRNGTAWTLQATLIAAGLHDGDWFGGFVAIKGDDALIAANSNNGGHGAAYVFTRSGTAWSEPQKLVPSPYPATASFGSGVAIGSQRAVVAGGPDSYVFVRHGTHWNQEFRVHTPKGSPLPAPSAIQGRTAIVVNKILYRSAHGWAVKATIANGASGGMSGDTIVIGEPGPPGLPQLDPPDIVPGQLRL